ITASAAQAPEKVSVLVRIRDQHSAVGDDDIDRPEVVAGETVFAGEPAKATPQGEAGDAGVGDRAPGRRQAENLCLAIEIRPGGAALSACRTPYRIDPDAAHAGEID